MDITVQKNLEDQVRQAQRMESIGNVAGGIAHDFNNLLTAIIGYSNVLIDESSRGTTPSDLTSGLDEIRKAGERAARLTSQLLAFSRKQIIQPSVLNLNEVVGGLETLLRRLIGEDIDFSVHLARDLKSTMADPGQIEQIVMNLVVNARDAMPRGGRLTIETANVDLDAAYASSHVAAVPGPYVVLAVSDNGIGIPPELHARIFEPFFTTKPKGRGTGLGLATIYGIVKQNNGYVSVYSEPNKGTTFRVYLPRLDEEPQPPQVRRQGEVRGGDETVLLVEDDERVRKLAGELLTRIGYTVLSAASPENAIRLVLEHTGPIHLLLTDVVMPGASGQQLAQALRDTIPRLKVLYMSGYTDDAIVHHGVLPPDVAFLQKPFTPAAFARAVRDALDRDR